MRDLEAHDVRLTMGGEPTYVGIDEPESAQWNIDALGDAKRTRGMDVIRGLREKFAPGGLLHYGQGKWYPGEPLPRWALSCFWRADGVPVWEDLNLIALENHDYGFRAADALRFMRALTRRLQVSAANILSAFDPDARGRRARGIHPADSSPAAQRSAALVEPVVVSGPWIPLFCCPAILRSATEFRPKRSPGLRPMSLNTLSMSAPFADRVKLPSEKSAANGSLRCGSGA